MSQPPEQPYPAQRPTRKEPHLPHEEVPTQRLPRLKMSMQLSSIQEMVAAGAADPAAADTEKADGDQVDPAAADSKKAGGEKELPEDEPDDAQDYRTQVEEAQLPDDVREAAPREVGKLERTGEQSAESGDIETWLHTMFDGTDRAAFLLAELLDGTPRSGVPMPYSANTPHLNTIPPDGQPQYPTDLEVEQKIRSLIQGSREADPPAADTENLHTKRVDSAAADTENLHTKRVDSAAADTENLHTKRVNPGAADTENLHTEKVDQAAADTKRVDGEKVNPTLMGEITWLVPPWAADTEMVDGEKVDPAAAEVEKADTAPADPHDDDTVEMPAVLAGLTADPHPPQFPEPQVHGPVPVQNPAEKRHFGSLALAVTALAALLIGALLFGASRDGGMTAQSIPTYADPDRDDEQADECSVR
jgi:hypothetical protein